MAPGWLFSLWAGYRWDRTAPVSNLAGRVLAGIWVGTGITTTLLGVMAGLMVAFFVLPGLRLRRGRARARVGGSPA